MKRKYVEMLQTGSGAAREVWVLGGSIGWFPVRWMQAHSPPRPLQEFKFAHQCVLVQQQFPGCDNLCITVTDVFLSTIRECLVTPLQSYILWHCLASF